MRLFLALFSALALALPAHAGRNFNGTSAYLEFAAAVATAEPITFACWFTHDNTTTSTALVSLGVSGGTNRLVLQADGAVAGDPITARSVVGTAADATTSTSFTSGTWQHACAVFTSSNSRAAFLNGGGKGTNTSSRTMASLNRTLIGARIATSAGAFHAGNIAEVGIWSAALTDAEVASLAQGFKPTQIRPQSLILYCPLIRDTLDYRGALTPTDNGPSTVAVHTRRYAALPPTFRDQLHWLSRPLIARTPFVERWKLNVGS